MKENFGFINVLKAMACLSVVFVHFRLNTMSSIPLESFGVLSEIFYASIYEFFYFGVPIFIMVSGFLMINKEYNKKYFLNLISIYILYLLSSLAVILLMKINNNNLSVWDMLISTFNFKFGYSWYVHMYIVLYLLMPLLNKIIHSYRNSEFLKIIIMLVLIIALPSMFSSIPYINKYFSIPVFWNNFYPVIYYFIGAYIRKNIDIFKNRTKELIASLLLLTFIGVCTTVLLTKGYTGSSLGDYSSIFVMLKSTIIFILIKNIFKKDTILIKDIANSTLSIYLISMGVDIAIYPFLISNVDHPKDIYIYILFIPLVVFIISYIISKIVINIHSKITKNIKNT